MIKRSTVPTVHVVALEAAVREPGRLMIGIVGILIILLVARVAIGGRVLVLAVDVTLCALHGYVSADQRERSIVMVKRGRLPGTRRVTFRARMRELIRHVIWIRR